MPLTTEDVGRIDGKSDTKSDLEEKLKEHSRDYPLLDKVDSEEQKREKMLEIARAAIEQGLSDQGKTDAINQLLDEQPNAVVVPLTQSFLMLTHPKGKEDPVRITVYEDMGWSTRETSSPEPRDPEEPVTVDQITPKVKPLDEIPEWGYPKIYDLTIMDDIGIFKNKDVAHRELETSPNRNEPILDDPSTTPEFEYRRDGSAYDDKEDQPIVAEATARFQNPAQKAAWNVLNNVVDQDAPLPRSPGDISSDPNDLTEAEISRVDRRIRTCLESPERFSRDARRGEFDERAFFDQLLECEMKGYNAPRGNGNEIGGVTRPEIIGKIREIASSRGFDVVGTFVREQPQDELEEQQHLPETVPMTPESNRKTEPTQLGSVYPQEDARQ